MKQTIVLVILVALVLVALVGSGSASNNADHLRFLQFTSREKHLNKRTNNYVQCWSQYGGQGRCCGTVDTRGVPIGDIDNHCTVQLGACCYGGANNRCHWQFGAICP